MVDFIKERLTKLDEEWVVIEVRIALSVLQVPVVSIISPGEMSMIGTLELSLED